MELRDQIVWNRARAQRDRDAARVHLLHESSQLQETLTLLARIGERAAHQVDVPDLGLADHRVQCFAHALERRRWDLDPTRHLTEVLGAFVGCAVGTEPATHRHAVVLVQKVLAARCDVDHQHVAMRGHASLRERQAIASLLRQPGPQRLKADWQAAATAIIDQQITLSQVAFDVPRRVAIAEYADLGAVLGVDEVRDGSGGLAGGVGLSVLESVRVVIGHRVRRCLA